MNYLGHYNMMNDWGGYGHVNDSGDWIFMITIMVAVILGVVLLVRFIIQDGSKDRNGNEAIEILRKRYAKGDITKKAFDDISKDLK